MFTAAGAAHREGVISIGGFVSDTRKWKRFELEWQRILERESISTFHMTDFVSQRGDFESWRGDPARSARLLSDLVECTRRSINKAFGGAVVLRDYNAVNKKYKLTEAGGYPYSLCGQYAIHLVRKWQRKNDISEVTFIFEDGDQHRGDLKRLCREERITPLFQPKKSATPCQAADLFAWRTRNAFEEALKPGLTIEKAQRLKQQFDQVWKRLPHAAFYGDAQRLERFCIERGIPRR